MRLIPASILLALIVALVVGMFATHIISYLIAVSLIFFYLLVLQVFYHFHPVKM